MGLIVLACILALFVWVQVWLREAAKAIKGCQHKHGELVPAVKDLRGRDTALVWICKDCPFQIPLKMHRVAGKTETWIRQEELDRHRKDHR